VFQGFEKLYLPFEKCTEKEKISAANLMAFPEAVTPELYDSIFYSCELSLGGICKTKADFIIGAYLARVLPGYQLILLENISVNPTLKSRSYGRDIINYLGEKGLSFYGENFKGIVSPIKCDKKKKSTDHKNAFLLRSMINSGGSLVVEGARAKNNHLHFIYFPYNGGSDNEEIQEVFKKIYF